ncbi:hypothetical protein DFH09DRAFT_1093493 [Mycena vulgaris]|nr:hypothetical protein DFH09DRAFT_1093493 [Mycena vulgaris]
MSLVSQQPFLSPTSCHSTIFHLPNHPGQYHSHSSRLPRGQATVNTSAELYTESYRSAPWWHCRHVWCGLSPRLNGASSSCKPYKILRYLQEAPLAFERVHGAPDAQRDTILPLRAAGGGPASGLRDHPDRASHLTIFCRRRSRLPTYTQANLDAGLGNDDDEDWEDATDLCSAEPSPAPVCPILLVHPHPPPPLPPAHLHLVHLHPVLSLPVASHPMASHVGIDCQREKIRAAASRKRKRECQNANLVDFNAADSPRLEDWCMGRGIAPRRPPPRRLPCRSCRGWVPKSLSGTAAPRDPKLIVDTKGRIIAILLGRPEDPDWDSVVRDAIKALAARTPGELRDMGSGRATAAHRRGRYFIATARRVSLAGGQKSLYANASSAASFRNKSLRRLAGFQSSTFNCGRKMVTFDHIDHLNLGHGLCGISCGGSFDHTLGGHIHLDLGERRLVIEFPSGSSTLIPSGFIRHGNTPIQPGETRYSLTQYAAGGLF